MNITTGVVAKAQKVVLYGPEGIGKSSLAAQFPDPLFIDTEGSTNNMDVARMDKPSSWQFLQQQVDFVKNNRPCKTLVIDTIDWAEHLGIQFIVSRGGKTSITGFGYGDGFIQLEEEIGKFLNKLSDLVEIGINVVLTAHAKIVRFEAPDEMGAYDRYELKLGNKTTAKTAALVKEWADMVLFLNYKTFSVATDDKGKRFKGQGGERKMYAVHHPAWDAKNRHGLPDEMPMDYSQIAHVFNVQAPDGTQQTWTSKAPDEQVKIETPTVEERPVSNTDELPQQNEQSGNTEQLPETKAETPQAEANVIELDPNIPQALRDLMQQHSVTEIEIQHVVAGKGYYPFETPIVNYDPSFIEGVLVGAWQQVHGEIKAMKEQIPFS